MDGHIHAEEGVHVSTVLFTVACVFVVGEVELGG